MNAQEEGRHQAETGSGLPPGLGCRPQTPRTEGPVRVPFPFQNARPVALTCRCAQTCCRLCLQRRRPRLSPDSPIAGSDGGQPFPAEPIRIPLIMSCPALFGPNSPSEPPKAPPTLSSVLRAHEAGTSGTGLGTRRTACPSFPEARPFTSGSGRTLRVRIEPGTL